MTARRMVRAAALIGAGWVAAATGAVTVWAAIVARRGHQHPALTTVRCPLCGWRATTSPTQTGRLLERHGERHGTPTPTRGTAK